MERVKKTRRRQAALRIPASLANAIVAQRERLGLTLEDTAKLIGMARGAVRLSERRKATFGCAARVAVRIGVPFDLVVRALREALKDVGVEVEVEHEVE